jgi:hypothetical protein
MEVSMRNAILSAAAMVAFTMFPVNLRAEGMDDKPEASSMTGVLIDNHCGSDMADAAAAAKHPISCAKKDACEKSGYQLVVGDKHYKFDDKGNEKAKEYLKTAKSTNVVVEGKAEGDKLEVAAIKAAPSTEKEGNNNAPDKKKDAD